MQHNFGFPHACCGFETYSLREKCPNLRSFFWPVFSRIRTEYGKIRSISPYSVRMRENTDQKRLRIWTLFVSLRIQSECGKIRTRKNSVFGHFSYLSVFSPNARKYGPEKTPYLDTFHAVTIINSNSYKGRAHSGWQSSDS